MHYGAIVINGTQNQSRSYSVLFKFQEKNNRLEYWQDRFIREILRSLNMNTKKTVFVPLQIQGMKFRSNNTVEAFPDGHIQTQNKCS